MGNNCCGGSSEPTCALGQDELFSINTIAKEIVNGPKSYFPYAAPYVAKCVISTTGTPFVQLSQKIMRDNVPIDQLRAPNVPPLQPPPGASIPQDPFSRIVAATISEVNRQVTQLLMTAAVNAVKGGNASDATAKQRCAQSALLRYSQQAVAREIDLILKANQADIQQYAGSPRAGSGNPASPLGNTQSGAPPVGSASNMMRSSAPSNVINNNNNNNSAGAAVGGGLQQASPPNSTNNTNPPSQSSSFNQQQQQPQQQKQEQDYYQTFQQSINDYNQQQSLAQEQDVASPTNEAWTRYPLPEENGPWVKINEAFFYSEGCGLYYFPAAGHFFDPNSGYWFDPDRNEWITEEQHESLLERMAAEGRY